MKLPKEVNAYCPFCGKHSVHTLLLVKKKAASELSQGQRRYRRKTTGYTGFPRPKPDSEKQTKRKDMRMKCKTCGKQHIRMRTFRAQKFEIAAVK